MTEIKTNFNTDSRTKEIMLGQCFNGAIELWKHNHPTAIFEKESTQSRKELMVLSKILYETLLELRGEIL